MRGEEDSLRIRKSETTSVSLGDSGGTQIQRFLDP